MEHLNHRFSHKRRIFLYVAFTALVGCAALLWAGNARVWAIGQPQDVRQTVPPRPTVKPTPLPTPTPRPSRPGKEESQQPTATPVVENAGQPTGGAALSQVFTGTISAPVLNVRQGPGTNFAVIGRLNGNTVVTVLARNGDGVWLNICCLPGSQTSGWVSAQYVTPAYSVEQAAQLPVRNISAAPSAPTTPASGPTGVVNAVSLNIREEPSTSAAVLGKLRNGATVTLLGRNDGGDWLLVCCIPGGVENGWVSAEFVTPGVAGAVSGLPAVTGRETPVAATEMISLPTATPTTEPAALADTSLEMVVSQSPTAAVQGDQIVLSFELTNTGTVTASAVEFSFELPQGLSFVSASATDGGEATQEKAESGALIVLVTWPDLATGVSTTAKITANISEDLPNGAVLDGSAVAIAENAASTFVPVSVGMPPAEPPDFQ